MRRGCVGGAVRRAWTAALAWPALLHATPRRRGPAGRRSRCVWGRGAGGGAWRRRCGLHRARGWSPASRFGNRAQGWPPTSSVWRGRAATEVSGCTMNKATRPPSRLENGTVARCLPVLLRTGEQKGSAAHSPHERLTRRPALPRSNARRRLRADKGTLKKRRRCRRIDALLRHTMSGYPREWRREMVLGRPRWATSIPL